MTSIFRVKLFKWLFWQVNAGKCKNCYCHQIGSQVFAIERDVVRHDVDLHFDVDEFWKRWYLKMPRHDLYRGSYLPSNVTIANVVLYEHDLHFQGQTFHVAIFTSNRWNNANITIAFRCEVRYFPSNGATANAVGHDLQLHFQGHTFWNVNISKAVRATEKCSSMSFIEGGICRRMVPVRMSWLLPAFSGWRILK